MVYLKRYTKNTTFKVVAACRQKGLRIEILIPFVVFIVKNGFLLSSCHTLRASPLYEAVDHVQVAIIVDF